jgi:hypothetical protein
MADDDHAKVVMQGAETWNAWRKRNPGRLHFAAPNWYQCPRRVDIQKKGRNLFNFNGMNLSPVSIIKAVAEGLNLRNAVFEEVILMKVIFLARTSVAQCFAARGSTRPY